MKLKLLLFCSGNVWNINHWWIFCTICLIRKKYFIEDFYSTSVNSIFTENLRNFTNITMLENLMQNFFNLYLLSILLVKLYL